MLDLPNAWDVAADLLHPPVDYLRDPAGWVRDRLGEFVWSKQVDILEAVRDHRHVAVHSCHDSGKSFVAARAVCWWLDAHPPGTAFAVTTAPTGAQVRAILWREINRAHAKGGLFGRTNQTEWWLGKEMVAFGRKPSDYDTEAFQGIHARYVLVVIDEANGVPKGLHDAAETLATNTPSRVLNIGNPDDPQSTFAENCKPGSGYHVIHIGAKDTPNFTGEAVPTDVSEQLISPEWVKERAERWGEDSPLYISKVEGNFPPYSADTVVPWSYVQACQLDEGEHIREPELGKVPHRVIGLDFGAGGDESVAWLREGNRAVEKRTDHSADPDHVVGMVMRLVRDYGGDIDAINADEIGIGWGAIGLLKRELADAGYDTDVVSINVAERAMDADHFLNTRAELWWDVGRENSRLRRWDLRAVDDDTVAQLITPKYKAGRNGLITVEKKDEIRKRLGRSTDDADALLMAFYEPPVVVWRAA